ncbi:MAG: hypothetical protein U9Q75_09145 [Pseudomonadota bacterium]|nr:hypothetical protein [Pseudomonadota bacterium]
MLQQAYEELNDAVAANDPRPCYYIFQIERDDLEEPPFGQGKMHQLFGADMDD